MQLLFRVWGFKATQRRPANSELHASVGRSCPSGVDTLSVVSHTSPRKRLPVSYESQLRVDVEVVPVQIVGRVCSAVDAFLG